LGVWEGDRVPSFEVPGGTIPATTLSLDCMSLGGAEGMAGSWTAMTLSLRDDPALGPFRLAYLEALVRLADWAASAEKGGSNGRS
jgi:CRISPR-associated endonuclease/helicase Cas3